MERNHEYRTHLEWNGNLGNGTATYQGYGRDYTVSIDGKPDMRGSADPMFRGNKDLHNPEDLFVGAISGCHMLSYLALCARKGISVLSYTDDAKGILVLDSHSNGKFGEVMLNPVVTIADPDKQALALSLHEEAHEGCFIAQSCSVPIHHAATVHVAAATEPR
jgi:organic hydroperoxide reductase OsmC/OhrA